ncbi:MAG TPA: mechanosensitive ion channel domain-containing protein [Nitrospira sp.]|jgi:small conductance mechanosensitive channel|nr:mechanosensitive ion channel domain-containing protein [Nitrospira sp.]
MAVAMDVITQYAVQYGLQALVAIGIFVAGVIAARWTGNLAQRQLERHALEPPVRLLLVRVVKIVVLLFTAVIALDALGVPIAPLVAGIGVAGVGIGLALQGVLGNVMAGLSIIFTKPFRVGEHVSILGVHGDVVTIDIFSTILKHPDHSRIVIPNRKIIGEILHNFGSIRQLHLTVIVSYQADIEKVLALIADILRKNTRILKEPAPSIGVSSLGESTITIAIEPWTSVADYGAAQGEVNRAILGQFRAHHIEHFIQEVRIINDPSHALQA